MEQGLRSLRDLTQHLTTRADDSHAPPVTQSEEAPISERFRVMSNLGKVLRVARIKQHAPPLVRAPVNSFEF